MTLREVWRIAGPLLGEAVKFYAPQVRIPSVLVSQATKYFGKGRKGVKKVRKRITQIDNLIEEMEDRLDDLKIEREEWVLQWADLSELLDAIQSYRRSH